MICVTSSFPFGSLMDLDQVLYVQTGRSLNARGSGPGSPHKHDMLLFIRDVECMSLCNLIYIVSTFGVVRANLCLAGKSVLCVRPV